MAPKPIRSTSSLGVRHFVHLCLTYSTSGLTGRLPCTSAPQWLGDPRQGSPDLLDLAISQSLTSRSHSTVAGGRAQMLSRALLCMMLLAGCLPSPALGLSGSSRRIFQASNPCTLSLSALAVHQAQIHQAWCSITPPIRPAKHAEPAAPAFWLEQYSGCQPYL